MIDLGLSKLAIIGVVALIVIGPEKLPKVARMAGSLYGRAQRYLHDVKAEVSREIELDELRKRRDHHRREYRRCRCGLARSALVDHAGGHRGRPGTQGARLSPQEAGAQLGHSGLVQAAQRRQIAHHVRRRAREEILPARNTHLFVLLND